MISPKMSSVSSNWVLISKSLNLSFSQLGHQKFGRLNLLRQYAKSSLSTSASALPKDDIQPAPETIKVEVPTKKKRLSLRLAEKTEPKGTRLVNKSVLTYIQQNSGIGKDLINLIPKRFVKSAQAIPTTAYLVNKAVASEIAEMIRDAGVDTHSPVMELHPGPGLLTKELVNNLGFKNVMCLEDSEKMAESLQERFNVASVDTAIDDLPRYHHLDKYDGGERIHNILSHVVVDPLDADFPRRSLHVIGFLPHVSSLNFLIRTYVTQRVFFEEDMPWTGVVFLIGLGTKADCILNATLDSGMVAYRPSSVLFQTLFKTSQLGLLSRKAFIPWEAKDREDRKGPFTRKLKIANPNMVKYIKLEANLETLERVGKENLFGYFYFVRQSLFARTNRVIPELEKWIPGCGIRLIKLGFNIFSQFGSLKPNEILDLYLEFISWPEFANSSFLAAVEKFQTRIEIAEEDA